MEGKVPRAVPRPSKEIAPAYLIIVGLLSTIQTREYALSLARQVKVNARHLVRIRGSDSEHLPRYYPPKNFRPLLKLFLP